MRIKKEYILLLLIIAVLGLYLWNNNTDRINYELPQIEKLKKEDIASLDLKKTNSSLSLRQKNGTWYIGKKRLEAKQEKVDKILDSIREVEITTLISRGKNYNNYNLRESQGISIKALNKSSNLLRKIRIGKSASSYNTNYVRINDDPCVYLARNTLSRDFAVSTQNLRDKTVLAFSGDKIRSLTINNSRTLKVQKKREQSKDGKKIYWQSSKGKSLNKKKIEDFLSSLNNLECASFYDRKALKQAESPDYRIGLKGKKTHTLELYVQEKDKKEIFQGTSSYSDYAFKLKEYQGRKIRDKVRSLLSQLHPKLN